MTSAPTSSRAVQRRFIILSAVKWLPTGLLIPVLVLLMLERGLTFTELGIVMAAQGLLVLLLELPTGGLADLLGRRPVLLTAAGFHVASIGLLAVASTAWLIAVAFALRGVYRALESGPLDSWYVDTAQAIDPGADIERGLANAGAALSISIAGGALIGSALVALDPFPNVDPLVVPLLGALVMALVEFGAISWLMVEDRPVSRNRTIANAVRTTPAVIGTAISTIRASVALTALVGIEFLWGFAMVAVERFSPAKLDGILGGAEQAAVLLGPLNAGGWLVAAAGAALVPILTRFRRPGPTAASLLITQALALFGIAVAVGPLAFVVAFVLIAGMNGALNPIHQGMLHRAVVDPKSRTTVISANSMTGHAGVMLGGIALGALATATTLTAALLVGAAIAAAAAPLYLLAARKPQRTTVRRRAASLHRVSA